MVKVIKVILEHKSKTFLSSTVYNSTKQLVHFSFDNLSWLYSPREYCHFFPFFKNKILLPCNAFFWATNRYAGHKIQLFSTLPAKEGEQINSLEEEIRVFLLHKYYFLAAEKYNAQGCKIAKAKTPSALEPCPCSCKSSSISHIDKLKVMTNCNSRIIGDYDHPYHKNDASGHHHHDPVHTHHRHSDDDEIANGRQLNM